MGLGFRERIVNHEWTRMHTNGFLDVGVSVGRMAVLRGICPVSFVAIIGGRQAESCDCLESYGHFDVVDGKVYVGAEAM
jgi:hypothetical protein